VTQPGSLSEPDNSNVPLYSPSNETQRGPGCSGIRSAGQTGTDRLPRPFLALPSSVVRLRPTFSPAYPLPCSLHSYTR
jgi:hypothetical protein